MRRALVTAVVLAPLLALGACGDDDGSSDASTSSSGGSGDSGGSVADSFRDDAIVTDGARDTGRDGDGPEGSTPRPTPTPLPTRQTAMRRTAAMRVRVARDRARGS